MEARRKRWWRGWWWKAPLVVLVLVAFAPTCASPLVRRAVTKTLERELGGEASFDDFSLSWPANLEVSGLQIRDSEDRPTLSLSALEASVDARALLAGRVAIDARGNRAELHLRQQSDRSWQLGEPPLEEEEEEQGDEPTEEDSDEGAGFSGDFWLDETTVVLHALDGEVRLAELELGGSLPADPSELTTFHVAFDAHGADGPAGTLRSDGKLVLGPLDRVDPRDIEASLAIDGLTLAALRPVLAVWLPERIPSGTLDTSLTLSGQVERLRLFGRSTVTDLEVEILSEDNDEPLVVRDPRVELDIDAELVPDTLDVALSKLSLNSRMARCDATGRITGLKAWQDGEGEVVFDGLKGSLVFVPDRLTELFGPDLPVQLAGDTERTIAFDLEGRAADMSLESFLAGCVANAKIELGDFSTTGIQGSGDLEVHTQKGRASWVGSLLANGGALDLAGDIDVGQAPGEMRETGNANLRFTAENLSTNAELAPLLSLLHPAFAAVEVLESSEISGRITCDLDLAYEGPLGSEALSGGWESFPKAGIRGSGRFTITEARLDGTPALGEMLAYLGVDTARSVDIRPIEFTIDAGRLTYARPWSWTIADVETTFSGSVGLDQTLALSWNVPVTEKLIEEHRFLRHVEGKLIRLPITGTVNKPKLEWQDALAQFATENVRDELLDQIGLGEGGGDDDPNQLLEEADKLWDEGKKVEAAAIYKRIRDEFKVSITYALNRDRIKKRGKYQE